MLEKALSLAILAALTSASIFVSPYQAKAQTYPIDCAILLCLSGGWPTSVPCARAKGVFIRRITPWPVEPPLQIWRCPMGASFDRQSGDSRPNLYEIQFSSNHKRRLQSTLPEEPKRDTKIESLDRHPGRLPTLLYHSSPALQRVSDVADIDVSGPEFDFVRSIRVFHVRYAYQRETGRDSFCERTALVFLGTYGPQGEFTWQASNVGALPKSHEGLEQWGEQCPRIFHSSVFVDWWDYSTKYGFEQVNY